MKIAVMMRAIDQPTGFRSYVEGLVDALLRIDTENEYLLLYRKPGFVGRFADYRNAKEKLIGPTPKLLWDQVGVPYTAWRERADIIFNPKFSVPLVSSAPVVMGLQEPTWFALRKQHPWWDVTYMRVMLPLYCRRARHLFPWTNFQLAETRRYIGMALHNASVTYGAPRDHFRKPASAAEIEAVRARYRLPDSYILSVVDVLLAGYDRPVFTPIKNVETTVRAFTRIRHRIPQKLVIAGRSVREFLGRRGWDEHQLQGVHTLGFVPNEELPALYAGADLFVIASLYEGFGMALVEAMAQGCAVVASSAGACPETSGGAALLADPRDPADFADKLLTVASDRRLQQQLREKSLHRSTFFDWNRTARIVLDGIVGAVSGRRSNR